MSMVLRARVGLAALALTAFVAVYLLSPVAEALNTHSIDLENSSDQFLSIADSPDLRLSGDFTVEMWVNAETWNSGYASALIAKDAPNAGWVLYAQNGGVNPNWQTNETNNHLFNSITLNTSQWYHFAVSQGGGTIKAFIDGVEFLNTTYTDHADSTGELRIGKMANQSVRQFDGLIDDVRIWNKARTETEINDDISRELNGNEDGLVAYWKLNNGLSDSSGNGHTLTNNNSATFAATPAFAGFTSEVLKVRKTASESVTSSTVLQKDDHLKLSLAANKSYIVDGVLLVSSASASPDFKMGFFGQANIDLALGYEDDTNGVVLSSGESTAQIDVAAGVPISVRINGTITTGESGDLVLKWAQNSSNATAVTVLKGSYLRAEEI